MHPNNACINVLFILLLAELRKDTKTVCFIFETHCIWMNMREWSNLLLGVDFDLALVLLEFRCHERQLALETRHVLGQFETLMFFLCQATRQISYFITSSLTLLLLVIQPAPPQRHFIGITDSTATSLIPDSTTTSLILASQTAPQRHSYQTTS